MKTGDTPQMTAGNMTSKTNLPTPPEVEEQIRTRAFELYLQRGMQDGFAEQDWLQAESEILSTHASLKAAA